MIANSKQHWALHYIGKPWVSGGQGPDGYDCWGLVRAVQKDIFGHELPLITADALNPAAVIAEFKNKSSYSDWRQVETPVEGDCVITKSAPDRPEHVGIYINVNGGRILQSVFGSGVVCVSEQATRKMIGQHLEYWRFVS